MKATEIIKDKKRVFAIVGIVILVMLLILAGGIVAFSSGNAEAGDIGGREAVGLVVGNASGIEVPPIEVKEEQEESVEMEEQAADPAQEAPSDPQAGEQHSAWGRQGDSSAPNAPAQSSGGSSGSKSGQAASSSSAPQKKWVEDTQQVWVEDKAAWTESVPVYSTKEVSVCNVCGADITGNTSAHSKAHMMAGEGSGHHSEVQKVVTGYNSVTHSAEGHWETKVVGGHWE